MEKILESENSYLTESKFFVTDFNTAIFADPFRIYFCNSHEAFALQVYHHLVTQFEKRIPEGAIDRDDLIFFMLYSDGDQFAQIFDSDKTNQVEFAKFNNNWVVGINGLVNSEPMDFVLAKVSDILNESFCSEYNFKSLKTH